MNTNTEKPETPEPGMLHHLYASIAATVTLIVILCGAYPLIVWGIGQAIFSDKANGSLIKDDAGNVIGSRLLGQPFAMDKYFHPRPSAAGAGYDAANSSGSNLGPTSAKLLYGTTKDSVFTIIAHDKDKAAGDLPGRVEATCVSAVAGKTIAVSIAGSGGATTRESSYDLDSAAVVTAQGRTLSKTTPAKGANLELKTSATTRPSVTAVTVIDKVVEGTVDSVDTNANKISVRDSSDNVTAYAVGGSVLAIVNGKSDAKLADVPTGASVRLLTATVEDYDGIADRVIQYCESNNISYTSKIPIASFKDDDGVDDVKLITAFNAATDRTITPAKSVPADAVTASGSGLDPHISATNADIQAQRVADARKVPVDKVKALFLQNTDGPDLGLLGDAGVNVVKLNLALDKEFPVK